jgi:hypothetical protein
MEAQEKTARLALVAKLARTAISMKTHSSLLRQLLVQMELTELMARMGLLVKI